MADQGSELDELRRKLAEAERTLGPMHPDSIVARKNLADECYYTLRIPEAYTLYQQVTGQSTTVFGPLDICTILARSGAASCLLEARRFNEAIASYDRLLPDWVQGFGPGHRVFLRDRRHLAQAWDALGNRQEAMTQYWRLLSDCDRQLGSDDELTRGLAGDIVPPPRPWWGTEPLGTHRLLLVAMSAVLAARAHGAALDTLSSSIYLNRHNAVTMLARDWGVSSREELLSMCHWLATEGHRFDFAEALGHPPAAWDFARYSYMVRNGFEAEYIDESEAWQLLGNVAGEAAAQYGSWRDFADDYLMGRLVWLGGPDESGGYPASMRRTIDAAGWLLDPSNGRSPWNRVPCDAIARPNQMVG